MWPFRRKTQEPPPPAEPEPAPPAPRAEPKPSKTADDILRQLDAETARRRQRATDAGLGRSLLAEGPVTRDFLRKQLAIGGKGDSYLRAILAKLSAPPESDLFDLLTRDYAIPDIDLKKCKVQVPVALSIPREIALKYMVVPIERFGDLLCVAFAETPNPNAIEAVRRATGLRVKALRCPPHHLRLLLRRLYHGRAASQAVPAVLISEEEYNHAADAPAARAEARWESLHATRGPIRAARFARR